MSSGPFLCYRELIPSTCVLCSAFFSSNGKDFLVTSSSTSLNVYRIQHKNTGQEKSSLQQVGTFNISGFPRDICCVEVSASLPDAQKTQHLLISLDKGKLVLVAFDTVFNSLQVLHMYNAEDGAIGDSACPRTEASTRLVYPGLGSNPFLTVDPETHVACMSINAFELFFLSYQSSLTTTAPPSKPFTLSIPSLSLPGALIDMCFISGYSHPTLAILQDTLSVPIGHVAKVAHTVTLTILAIDIVSQKCVPLWQQKKLPHDSCRLVHMSACRAVPAGVLVITLNAVLIATQESVFGLASNGFAKVSVSDHIPLVAWPLSTGVELHASRWQEVSPGSFVGSLVDGSLLLLHLESTAPNAVFGESSVFYDVDIIGKSIETTCFCVLSVSSSTHNTNTTAGCSSGNTQNMLWFLGSSVSDCLLLDVVMTTRPIHNDTSRHSSGLIAFGNGLRGETDCNGSPRLVAAYGRGGEDSIYLSNGDAATSAALTTTTTTSTAITATSASVSASVTAGTVALLRTSSSSSSSSVLGPPPKRLRLRQSSDSTPGGVITLSEADTLASAATRALREEADLYHCDDTADFGSVTASATGTDTDSTGIGILQTQWAYPEFSLHIADSLVVLGPILSGNFFAGNEESLCSTQSITWDRSSLQYASTDATRIGKSSAAAYITDREARDTLEVAAGVHGRASLLRVSKGLHLSKLAARNFTHVTHSCTLPYTYTVESPREDADSASTSKQYCGTFFFLSEAQGFTHGHRNRRFGGTVKESSKVVLATENVPSTPVGGGVSSSGDTVAVHMEELKGDRNAFCTEQQTVSVGLVQADIIVQSCSQCLRVVQVIPTNPDEDNSGDADRGADGSGDKKEGFAVDLMAIQDLLVEEEVDMGGFGGSAGQSGVNCVEKLLAIVLFVVVTCCDELNV